jgi:hypothetical protein
MLTGCLLAKVGGLDDDELVRGSCTVFSPNAHSIAVIGCSLGAVKYFVVEVGLEFRVQMC